LSPCIQQSAALAKDGYRDAVRSFKARLIRSALAEARGSRTEAARMLRLHPSNLARMARSLGIAGERDGATQQRLASESSPPEGRTG
jgi:transcriptional regulator with GAF, ATPase, and Fis domain